MPDDELKARTGTANRARTTGAALEAHYRFLLWPVPALERLPRKQNFPLGDGIQGAALDVLQRLIEATGRRRRRLHAVRTGWWRRNRARVKSVLDAVGLC